MNRPDADIRCCKCPGDTLDKLHQPLESPTIVGCAFAIPGGDTARQDSLNGVSVKVCEGLRGQAECLQPPEDIALQPREGLDEHLKNLHGSESQ